jgi:hypothetical protein
MPDNMKVVRLEANYANMQTTLNEIKGNLERSTLERTSQFAEIIKGQAMTDSKVAVLGSKMEDYQRQCTDDRKEYNTRITDSERAIERLTNNQSKYAGAASSKKFAIVNGVAILAALAAWYPAFSAWAHKP